MAGRCWADKLAMATSNGLSGRFSVVSSMVALAMTGVLATPALAQGGAMQPTSYPRPADNDDGSARAPAGVPGLGGYPGRGLNVNISMNSRYESNLTRRAGVTDDGFRLRPSIRAGFGVGSGRQHLFAEGEYARDFVEGNNVLRGASRYRFGGGVDFDLSRCKGEAGGSIQRGLNFTTETSAFGAFELQNAQYGVTASCRLGGALGVTGSLTRGDMRSFRGGSIAFDVARWSYSAGITLGAGGIGQLSLTGSQTDLDNRGRLVVTSTGSTVTDGLRLRSARLGFQRQLGNRINLGLGLSYLQSRPTAPSQLLIIDGQLQTVDRPGFEGLGYDAAVDLRLSPRLSINLTALRNVNSTGTVGARFTITNDWVAELDYRLGGGYVFSMGARARHGDYRGSFTSALEPLRRLTDNTTRLYAQLGGNLGQRLRFSIDVTHNRRRSNPSALNFSSTGVGLNLGLRFGKGQ